MLLLSDLAGAKIAIISEKTTSCIKIFDNNLHIFAWVCNNAVDETDMTICPYIADRIF